MAHGMTTAVYLVFKPPRWHDGILSFILTKLGFGNCFALVHARWWSSTAVRMATPKLEHAKTEVEVDVEPEQSVQSVPSLQAGNQPPSSQTPSLLWSHESSPLRQPDASDGEELGWQSVQSVPVAQ